MTKLNKAILLLSAAGVVTLGSLGVVTAQQGSFGMRRHNTWNRMGGWQDSQGSAMTGSSWKGREREHHHGRDMINGRHGRQMCRRGDRWRGDGQGATLPPANHNPQGARGEEPVPPAATSNEANQKAFGRSLVADLGCQSCHQLGSDGGQVGPSLNGVVGRQGEEYVYTKLADPGFDVSNSRMPNFGLSTDEIEAIVAYLATLDSA